MNKDFHTSTAGTLLTFHRLWSSSRCSTSTWIRLLTNPFCNRSSCHLFCSRSSRLSTCL